VYKKDKITKFIKEIKMAKYKIIKTSGPVTFPLSTVFVDKYMPGANPLYVQVYLYGLRLCYGAGMESDNKKIAEALDMLETDVYRAFKYWEKKGIVKLSGDGVEFVDLSSEAVEEKSEKPTYKPDEISDIIDHNNEIKQLILHAECIFGKTLSQSDTATLLSFYDWLRLPLEVILMLLEHCAALSKTSMRYAEKVAISWADEGIDTIDKAKEFLVNSEKRSKMLGPSSGNIHLRCSTMEGHQAPLNWVRPVRALMSRANAFA